MNRKPAFSFIIVILITLLTLTACTQQPSETDEDDSSMWAGIRASSYGLRESFGRFPKVSELTDYLGKMESCYEDSTGTCLLIVGVIGDDNSTCYLDFPLSKEIGHAIGEEKDLYESYLTAMDKAGYSVWLQVEPGDADIVELATEVMNHYKHHRCVKGFGIDVEWYKASKNPGRGTPLDKTTARNVLSAVRNVKKNYTVFIKHWVAKYLTEGEPLDGFIYVDDSQGFREKEQTAQERMCQEFADWAENFNPCPVMFQIGYDNDRTKIWGSMTNPAKELGTAILEECGKRDRTNTLGIIWVDFTLKEAMEKIQPNE